MVSSLASTSLKNGIRSAPRMMAKRNLATQVPMSILEKDKFINYQRIEDNLRIVRDR
jgi:hypothetical protein